MVEIEEHYDGFSISVDDQHFFFNQENIVEELVDVFRLLGIKATYTEVY